MYNEELIAKINSLSDDALGSEDSDLANQRAEALDRYYGRPYGDEMEGRSQVVSRDLSEVIDWMLPQLMEVFLASGNVVEFLPISEDDEDKAEQESDYINHVIMQKNNGWQIFHDWFKDALLLKNGYVKSYWKTWSKDKTEKYEGLNSDEFLMLMMTLGDRAELIEHEESVEQITTPGGQLMELPIHKVEVRITEPMSRVVIECVPPEEIRISKRCRGDINDTDFIEHRTQVMRSELIEMGMDEDFVMGLPACTNDENDSESDSRDSTSNERESYSSADETTDMIEYREVYIKCDYNDDGMAELRKVVVVGNQIPDGDEWNEECDHIPFSCISPKRMPHRHIGESIHDDIHDIAEMQTVLKRQYMDNLYGLINQEWLVNERVKLDDFLVSKPLGVKRIKGLEPVDGCARAVEKPAVLQQVMPAIDYWDKVRSDRTGVKPEQMGLDPDALQNTTKGAYMQNLKQSNSKLMFIARMFAEFGVKDLVRKVHMLTRKHMDKSEMIKLRGEYTNVDPREWIERDDLVVQVGLGTGNDEEKRENAMIIAQLQERLAQMGLVSPKHAFNTFSDIVNTMGYLTPSRWVMNPESEEYQQAMAQQAQQSQQPMPNPLAEVEQIKQQSQQQIAQMKEQMKMQSEQQKRAAQFQEKLASMQADIALARLNNKSKENIAIMEAEVRALIEGFNMDLGQPGIGAELG